MRPLNYLPSRELLLTTLTSVSLYGTLAYAQQNDDNKDNNNNDANNKNDNPPAPAPAPEPTNNDNKSADNKSADNKSADNQSADNKSAGNSADNKPTAAADNSAVPPAATQKSDAAKPASTADDKPVPTQDNKDKPVSTQDDEPTNTADAPSSFTTLPTRLSSADPVPTDMPTLTKLKPIPTYPAPSVPPTVNAPFMQHSSAPDGTVFIAVGAILGAFGLAILLWRLIVGILLHRSVERAAKAQHDANAKTGFPAPPAPFYKYTDNASAMSLSTPGRGVRRTTRGPIPSSNPSQSNLFFSPTAAASSVGGGNRTSAFLPSGFYAAGSGAPGQGHEHSISLTNLRPDSRGQFGNNSRHTLNPSPPDSPSSHGRRDISNASLNLHRPPSQRAPSAFLDDLLADDPSALPPPNMPASRHSSYGNGSPGPQNRF